MRITDHLSAAAGHLRQARALGVTGLDVHELAATMQAVRDVSRVVQAIELDATAAADTADVARSQGAASTQAWLAHSAGVSHREASRELKLAQDLQTVAPQTRQAMSTPGMSADKARVIAGAMTKLPRQLDQAHRVTVEADLVAKATQHSYEDLCRAAKRAVEIIDRDWADQLEAATLDIEEANAHRQADFWMRPADDDGMVDGGFTLPQLEADILRSALESHTSPRHDCTTQPDESTDLLDTKPTYRHKLGRAFAAIIGHIPTDSFGNHGGVAATLLVTVDYDSLKGDTQAAGTDSHGNRIAPDTIRKLACEAGILPVVLSGDGRVLDVGSQKRLFTPAQRIALAHRDGGCAFPACDRPPGWTEAHHMTPWKIRQRTNLADGVLLCARHHRIIHHTDWQVRPRQDDQPEFIPPAHADPQQRPRLNDRWRPSQTPAARAS